jgi:hypothetical protein
MLQMSEKTEHEKKFLLREQERKAKKYTHTHALHGIVTAKRGKIITHMLIHSFTYTCSDTHMLRDTHLHLSAPPDSSLMSPLHSLPGRRRPRSLLP